MDDIVAFGADTSANEEANRVLKFYLDLIGRRNAMLHFAPNSVLDWFGRSVNSSAKMNDFLRFDVDRFYQHLMFERAVPCAPIEIKNSHLRTMLPYKRHPNYQISRLNRVPITLRSRADSDVEENGSFDNNDNNAENYNDNDDINMDLVDSMKSSSISSSNTDDSEMDMHLLEMSLSPVQKMNVKEQNNAKDDRLDMADELMQPTSSKKSTELQQQQQLYNSHHGTHHEHLSNSSHKIMPESSSSGHSTSSNFLYEVGGPMRVTLNDHSDSSDSDDHEEQSNNRVDGRAHRREPVAGADVANDDDDDASYTPLRYLKSNGVLQSKSTSTPNLQRHRHFCGGTCGGSTSPWDRKISLKISYRLRIADNEPQISLVIYEHIGVNGKTCHVRRNLMDQFEQTMKSNNGNDVDNHDGNGDSNDSNHSNHHHDAITATTKNVELEEDGAACSCSTTNAPVASINTHINQTFESTDEISDIANTLPPITTPKKLAPTPPATPKRKVRQTPHGHLSELKRVNPSTSSSSTPKRRTARSLRL